MCRCTTGDSVKDSSLVGICRLGEMLVVQVVLLPIQQSGAPERPLPCAMIAPTLVAKAPWPGLRSMLTTAHGIHFPPLPSSFRHHAFLRSSSLHRLAYVCTPGNALKAPWLVPSASSPEAAKRIGGAFAALPLILTELPLNVKGAGSDFVASDLLPGFSAWPSLGSQG